MAECALAHAPVAAQPAVPLPPPVKAKFLMEWAVPYADLTWNKLAWSPEGHLMVTCRDALWRIVLDPATSQCEPTLLHMTTSHHRDVKMADDGTMFTCLCDEGIIEIHDPRQEKVQRWRPQGVSKPWAVALNNTNIFIHGFKSDSISSYSRGLEHVRDYVISPYGGSFVSGDIHVTERGSLVVSSYGVGMIYIVDLDTGATRSFGSKGAGGGQLNYPTGVCTVHGGEYIIVCDGDNHRVCVFTHEGQFIHHLDVERGVRLPASVAVLTRRDQPPLLALYMVINNRWTVRIYSLS